MLLEPLIRRVIEEVRPYSMVPDQGLAATIHLTLRAIEQDIPGDLVECGTWRGGASFAMLLAQRYYFGEIRRNVWMYDSFCGMGEPSEQDGEHARWWKERSLSGRKDPDKQEYCVASFEQVLLTIQQLDLGGYVYIHPGWLHETIPRSRPSRIAVLRVDCDWYEPCKLVYEELAPLVAKGGVILIDDYYAWEGCILATHEYLATHRLPWRIRSITDLCGAWMIKEAETW